MHVIRQGDRLNYEIRPETIAIAIGEEAFRALGEELMGDEKKLDFSTASDNGNSVRCLQNPTMRYMGELLAVGAGYAAITTIVQKPDGTVVCVLGQQLYVLNDSQIAEGAFQVGAGELPIIEFRDPLTAISNDLAKAEAGEGEVGSDKSASQDQPIRTAESNVERVHLDDKLHRESALAGLSKTERTREEISERVTEANQPASEGDKALESGQ